VSILAKRAVWTVLTVIGLVLLGVGLWFAGHLGTSGSATFSLVPRDSGVVVLEPSVLNRTDEAVEVTATAADGGRLWIGRATPSDASDLVGGAARTTVTGVEVREWSLSSRAEGAGPSPTLGTSDIWRQQRSGAERVSMTVQQGDAPETVVLGSADGSKAGLESVTVTVSQRTWFFQSLVAALVGLIAVVAGGFGLWSSRPRRRGPTDGSDDYASGGPPEGHAPGRANDTKEVPV
jgi:hypothetical protein